MTDPDLWRTLATQVPGLVVLVILVIIFLKHLTDHTAAFERMLKEIGETCHEHQKTLTTETHVVLQRSNMLLDRNMEALGRASFLFERSDHRKG